MPGSQMGGAQNRRRRVIKVKNVIQSKISKTEKTLGRGIRENAGIINQEIVARVVHRDAVKQFQNGSKAKDVV